MVAVTLLGRIVCLLLSDRSPTNCLSNLVFSSQECPARRNGGRAHFGVPRYQMGTRGRSRDHDSGCMWTTVSRSAKRMTGFVDDARQLLCQGARGLVELNKAACLHFDVSSFQVITDRLAKLVSCANSFANQE